MAALFAVVVLAVATVLASGGPPESALLLGPAPGNFGPFLMNVSLSSGMVTKRPIVGMPPTAEPGNMWQLDRCRVVNFIYQDGLMAVNMTILNVCGENVVVESNAEVPPSVPTSRVLSCATFDGNDTVYIPGTGNSWTIEAVSISKGQVIDSCYAGGDYPPVGQLVLDKAKNRLYFIVVNTPEVTFPRCDPNCAALETIQASPLRWLSNKIFAPDNGPEVAFYAGTIGMVFSPAYGGVLAIGLWQFHLLAQVLDVDRMEVVPLDSNLNLTASYMNQQTFNGQLSANEDGWIVFCANALNGHGASCVRYLPASHTMLYSAVINTPLGGAYTGGPIF